MVVPVLCRRDSGLAKEAANLLPKLGDKALSPSELVRSGLGCREVDTQIRPQALECERRALEDNQRTD